MTVAYFCMEYALETLPIFAGGLGVLAGDLVLEAGSSQAVDLVAVGLFYHEKVASPEEAGYRLRPERVEIELFDSHIKAGVWEKAYGRAKVYLLSTNVPENPTEMREITRSLYGPDHETMLRQQLVLGLGGVKLLADLGVKVDVYHLNEGHTAFVLFGLITQMPSQETLERRLERIKAKIVGTKHTILSESGLHLPEEVLAKVLAEFLREHNINIEELFQLGLDPKQPGTFSTTKLLLSFARVVSGVSQTHVMYEKMIHPESRLIPITNGINEGRWSAFRGETDVWSSKRELRARLGELVADRTGSELDPDTLTIVWARRFASYKRPGLIFNDLNRLKSLVGSREKPVQIVISGKVAESDSGAKALVSQIEEWVKIPELENKVVFLSDYNLESARVLIGGADVWLNTPEVGKEACGTSGMKAGLNGALMISTDDGWMAEVGWANLGWILPGENSADWLYKILETEVGPLFYKREKNVPSEWVERMKRTREMVREKYTTNRMLAEYLEKLYNPATSL